MLAPTTTRPQVEYHVCEANISLRQSRNITPTTSEYHSRSEYHSNKVGISLAKRSEADEHCSPLQPLDRRSNITFAKQTYHYGKAVISLQQGWNITREAKRTSTARPYIAFPKIGEGGPLAVDEDDSRTTNGRPLSLRE